MIIGNEEDGGRYNVHFHYFKYDGKRMTFCTIHPCPCTSKMRPCGTVPAATAHSECSRRDEFRKSTGRKIALARAMTKLGLLRPHREKLWTSYFSKVKKD